jgi:hypothetical protein
LENSEQNAPDRPGFPQFVTDALITSLVFPSVGTCWKRSIVARRTATIETFAAFELMNLTSESSQVLRREEVNRHLTCRRS